LPFSRLWTGEDVWSRGADLAREVFNEVRRQDTILFLPDAVASLGSRAGGVAVDRVHAELLLALRSDEVPCILTATPTGYQRCLERHPSLEFLIQPVTLRPLTVEETVTVVHGVCERYERHHRVRVSDEAASALVEAADRQLPGALPGKAMRVLDRAAARARAKAWQSSGEAGAATGPLDALIQELNRQKEDAVGARDFDRAAELRDRADAIRKEIDRLLQQLNERDQLSDSVVDPAIVAEVVRDMAGDGPPLGP
jgi:ATP-dependent Clp protease ATP-binding subunit ClpC